MNAPSSPSGRPAPPLPDPNPDPRRGRWARLAASLALVTGALLAFGSDLPAGPRLLSGLGLLALTLHALPKLAAAWLPDLVAHTAFGLRSRGLEHLPSQGGALLVANHVSFTDALFLLAASRRPIRFLVDGRYARHRLLRPFLRAAGAIPIETGSPRHQRTRALRAAIETLAAGGLVGIFAEGEISRSGSLLRFRRGLEVLAREAGAPIVPVHVALRRGAWLAWSGRGRFVAWPRRLREPVGMAIGAPLPPETPAAEARRSVQQLGAEAWPLALRAEPVHARALRSIRRAPFAPLFIDSSGRSLRGVTALAIGLLLSRRLASRCPGEPRIGLWLPPSAGGALSLLALSLGGRTSVPLNYTTGRQALAAALERSKLDTVITSRAFLDRSGLELPGWVRALCLEELLRDLPSHHIIITSLLTWLAPRHWLERFAGAPRPVRAEDVATILFSSGSSGDPKGIVLEHRQLAANVAGATQVVPLRSGQKLLGVLPFFHAFGTLALWFATGNGASTAFHPSPLDVKILGRLISTHGIEVLVAPPTFLGRYLERWDADAVRSLQLVIAGAEALPESLAAAFDERFGIVLREGYGATECSPVISVNTPSVRGPGGRQAGTRRGTVGRPLPNVAVRVVDREGRRELPLRELGRIQVRGDSVMRGYLDAPERTARVLEGGWYDTGDLGSLDTDGFLRVVDRAGRFSKIGGEMVPHGTVERALQDASGRVERCVAVTSVPDARRGERLVVLHTLPEGDLSTLLAAAELPPLFRPHPDDCLRVDALPLLGSGKLDLAGLKAEARRRLGADAPGPHVAQPSVAPILDKR